MKGEFVAKRKVEGEDSVMIPVGKTIGQNFIPERLSGAHFRLIVFPDNFTLAGVWRFYDIRFILIDAATDKQVLEYAYSGKHMVMLRDGENAVARSKKILDHAFAEMKAKGLALTASVGCVAGGAGRYCCRNRCMIGWVASSSIASCSNEMPCCS